MRRFSAVGACGLALMFVVTVTLPAARAQSGKGPALRVSCDRETALYKAGETATFLIQSSEDGEATYRISNDGFKTLQQGKMKLAKGKTYSLRGTLNDPGFLQLRVEQHVGDVLAPHVAFAAAGFDPTQIEPTAQMPDDFDAFWAAARKELANVPTSPQVSQSIQFSTDRVTCYRVTLNNIADKKVYGWLAVPKGEGPFPAVLTLPGAGVYGIKPDIKTAELGALSMNIIIHDVPADEPPDFYKKLGAGPLKDYRDKGMDNKNKNYYRAAILGCVRCLDYLSLRPDYNGTDIAVTGGSQGGALTLIVSGLDSRVKLAAPNVAAMCDHSGRAHGRVSGWPHWLSRVGDDKAKFPKVLETSAYYDAVNFARKFKGKSLHGVGFIDTVCAPTTVYAAYNVHPEPKQIVNSPLMGHGTDPRWLAARTRFFQDNMKLRPPPK
jgi:cephalosporin-C deacetylase